MSSYLGSTTRGKESPKLILPSDDSEEWAHIEFLLCGEFKRLSDIDIVLTAFADGKTNQKCHFFEKVPFDGSNFDFHIFWSHGFPFMLEVALEMPILFASVKIPLLLEGDNETVTLTRRQCACLLAHSFFGSISDKARAVSKKNWLFRVHQLFFLEALPSAFCFLNYFNLLAVHGMPVGDVKFERCGFPRGNPPWQWEGSRAPLIPVTFDSSRSIEEVMDADTHADFANKFVGGGCCTGDFAMEEILFMIKPELIVAAALTSHLHDEEVVKVHNALQYSVYSGFASSFAFEGEYADFSRYYLSEIVDGSVPSRMGATVVAMDALQGCKHRQFEEALVLRDLNKARLAFAGAVVVASGNWGCGAFGNDHTLKFIQQWLAASSAGCRELIYCSHGDSRAAHLSDVVTRVLAKGCGTVGGLWEITQAAASESAKVFPPPLQKEEFLRLVKL